MNMQLFLEQLRQQRVFQKHAVICFYGKQYPLLFFLYCISFLEKNNVVVERYELAECDVHEAATRLLTETIAGPIVYFLSDFYTLSLKKQQSFLSYLQSYRGPHTVLLFCSDESASAFQDSAHHVYVSLDDVSTRDYGKFKFLVCDIDKEHGTFGRKLLLRSDRISVDMTILLIFYELSVGKSVDDFFSLWFTAIVEPTSSLFLLSQHFFAKKSRLFFAQWSIIAEQYAPNFWIVFWADQLWRASAYCLLMKQKQHVQAKKAQYKLPFSFINRDWSMYSSAELDAAYRYIYSIDFRVKSSDNCAALEYFFSIFFENAMKRGQ